MAFNLLKRILSVPVSYQERYQEIMRYEARIGGQLFGPVPKDRWREFFCLDEYTWIWHEEWRDKQTKQHHSVTTRYDVRANGVFKSQGNLNYRPLSDEELVNFNQAVKLYGQKVSPELKRLAEQTV